MDPNELAKWIVGGMLLLTPFIVMASIVVQRKCDANVGLSKITLGGAVLFTPYMVIGSMLVLLARDSAVARAEQVVWDKACGPLPKVSEKVDELSFWRSTVFLHNRRRRQLAQLDAIRRQEMKGSE